MPTDFGDVKTTTPIRDWIVSGYKAGHDQGGVPGLQWTDRFAHWALRIPLAGMLFYYGMEKFPSAFTNPGDYGVPALLYIKAAFAEVLGAAAIISGGLIETWRPKNGHFRLAGDVLTRLGGLAGFAAVMGVIVFFYWGALTVADLQVMALGLSVYVMLRGNQYGRYSRT